MSELLMQPVPHWMLILGGVVACAFGMVMGWLMRGWNDSGGEG